MKYFIAVFLFLGMFLFVKYLNFEKNYSQPSCIKIIKPQKSEYRNYLGEVVNQKTSEISFRSSGRIIYFPFTKGDYVKKGQILGKIDGTLYEIQKKEEESKLEETQVVYNHSKKYYERMDILHKAGAISDNDWEDAYFKLREQEKEVSYKKEIVKYYKQQIQYNTLISPIDGIIGEKVGEVGEYAKTGDVVLVIYSNLISVIEANIESNLINDLKVNDKVIVNKNDRHYQGKIAHISSSSIIDGGYVIKIYLDKFYPELKAGMSVDIQIPYKTNRWLIPISSIFEDNYIYLINEKKEIKKQKISPINVYNDKVEIKDFMDIKNIDIIVNPKNYIPNEKIKLCE